MAESIPTFFCAVCFQDPAGNPAAIIGGAACCQRCFDLGVRPQFERHLVSEYAPMVWPGRVVLEAIRHQFSESFMRQYEQRLEFYAIPAHERLYCAAPRCEEFLGAISLLDRQVTCSDCSGTTCSQCSAHITNPDLDNHTCADQADRLRERFEGQTRGRDYQLCPQCSIPVALQDGCNHMSCPCGTQFCYLCGERVFDTSFHWNDGSRCARYNGSPPRPATPIVVAPAPAEPLPPRRPLPEENGVLQLQTNILHENRDDRQAQAIPVEPNRERRRALEQRERRAQRLRAEQSAARRHFAEARAERATTRAGHDRV